MTKLKLNAAQQDVYDWLARSSMNAIRVERQADNDKTRIWAINRYMGRRVESIHPSTCRSLMNKIQLHVARSTDWTIDYIHPDHAQAEENADDKK